MIHKNSDRLIKIMRPASSGYGCIPFALYPTSAIHERLDKAQRANQTAGKLFSANKHWTDSKNTSQKVKKERGKQSMKGSPVHKNSKITAAHTHS